jgi:alkylation response protein AidB-like acyl-CoA dehydrogenase
VNLVFSDEQEELRTIVRQFLEAKSPEAAVREAMATDDGYDPAVWTQMAEQLGLQSLTVPEEFGGQGFGYMELVIVFEEMGRALLCAPYFSTVALAVNTLLVADDPAANKAILPGIASGETIATLALTEPSGRWDEEGVGATATEVGGGWSITGTKSYVLDGHVADVVLVAARTSNGVSLFRVTGDADGLGRVLLPTMDQTRKQAQLVFEGVQGTLIGAEGTAWPTLSKVLDLAAVALAAEQVGGAQSCLDMAVEYSKARVQFGRPIGSFQAIKHRSADLLMEVESARSAAYYAGACAAEDSDELPAAASLVKAACSEAFFHAAGENIQIHGGIGFTWEHPAHLYFKRSQAMSVFLGDTSYHRELVAQRNGF